MRAWEAEMGTLPYLLRVSYAVSVTGLAYDAKRVSGTEAAYGGTPYGFPMLCSVLTECMMRMVLRQARESGRKYWPLWCYGSGQVGFGILLRAPYALSGTDSAYDATRRIRRGCCTPVPPCPIVLHFRYAVSGTDIDSTATVCERNV
eukprot:604601-Rhodomonas_salina.9